MKILAFVVFMASCVLAQTRPSTNLDLGPAGNLTTNTLNVTGTSTANFSTTGTVSGQNLVTGDINPTVSIPGANPSYLVASQNGLTTTTGSITTGTNLLSVANPASFVKGNEVYVTDAGTQYAITSVANASGGSTVYTGTFTGLGSNACATTPHGNFHIAGFTNAANNGTWGCTASTATTITLSNNNGVSETHAATATEPLITYIAAVLGPIFTLGANASNTVSSLAVQHDESAAFQGAINALATPVAGVCTGCTGGRIILQDSPNGAYLVNGQQQFCDTTGNQHQITGILCLPDIDQVTTGGVQVTTIEIDGDSQASDNFTANPVVQGGALIKTSISCNTCNVVAGKGATNATVAGDSGFTGVLFASKNVRWQSYNDNGTDATHGPNITLINCQWCVDLDLENDLFDTGTAPTNLPTHTNGIAVIAPGTGNYGQVIMHNFIIAGHYIGAQIYEHTLFDMRSVFNNNGLIVASGSGFHDNVATYFDSEDTVNSISPLNSTTGGSLEILKFDTEHDAGTFANVCDICDSNNQLVGTIRHYGNTGGSAVYTLPNITGNAAFNPATGTITLGSFAVPYGERSLAWTVGGLTTPLVAGINQEYRGDTLVQEPPVSAAAGGGYITKTIANFTGHTISACMKDTYPTGANNIYLPRLAFGKDTNNYIAIDVFNGNLRFFGLKGGALIPITTSGNCAANVCSLAYVPASHYCIQLSESSGTVTGKISTDPMASFTTVFTNAISCGSPITTNCWDYTTATIITNEAVPIGAPSQAHPGRAEWKYFQIQ